MRVATFNVQNLRLREDEAGHHFDGARDEVAPLSKLSPADRALDRADRALTAELIAHANADILALQEVFDQYTLDAFDRELLAPLGASYPHRICVPGNDGRRHVALMSRVPLSEITSHATTSHETLGLAPPSGELGTGRVFRRDCLMAQAGGALIMVVHFKAPADDQSLAVVRLEALAVRMLIQRRFKTPARADWVILGDVNVDDARPGDAMAALCEDFAVDLARDRPPVDRWTYFHAGHKSYARPDRILVSPAFLERPYRFDTLRQGMSRAASVYQGPRLEGVGEVRPRASDHALLLADVRTHGDS